MALDGMKQHKWNLYGLVLPGTSSEFMVFERSGFMWRGTGVKPRKDTTSTLTNHGSPSGDIGIDMTFASESAVSHWFTLRRKDLMQFGRLQP